jgi:ATP-dependent RNA helicase DDX54/DBP10
MSHHQKDAHTDRGYSLRDGATFVEQARTATFDLTTDEAVAAQKRASLNWDKKKKKFVKGSGEGADNVKMVRTESGTKLPASYRSGRFDEWKAKQRVRMPKVGEDEGDSAARFGRGGKKWRHTKEQEAKPLDKFAKDYERKVRQGKKRDAEREPAQLGPSRGGKGGAQGAKGAKGTKSRYGGKPIGRVKSELKNAEQIRKARKMQDQKRAKNARPTRKGRR